LSMPRIAMLHGRTTGHAGARRAFRSLLAAGLLVPLAGCTLVVDTSKREPCSTHAECTARYGEPSACVESSCVKLLTEECTQVLPAGVLEEENTILFGFMGALTGDFSSYGTPPKEGAELAFDEIQANSNGIPGVGGPTLVGVYVAPGFRGRRAGVTDALLDAVEAWAREHADVLRLEVNELNARARAAYERRGFVLTGRTSPYPLDPPSLELEMIKRL